MDLRLVSSSLYTLPSASRVDAIVYDGAADLRPWRGLGSDRDLAEHYGPGLESALQQELQRMGAEALPMGSVVRVHAGRLHCDFLAWVVTRPPERNSVREPAPGAELLAEAVMQALRFSSERDVSRIAFPALGEGPQALDPAERFEIIWRTALKYEEECYAAGRSTVIEEVFLCEPDVAVRRALERRIPRLQRLPVAAAPSESLTSATATRSSSRSSSPRKSSTASKSARSVKRPASLTPEEKRQGMARAKHYSLQQTYSVGEWVSHPRFGLGRVEAVVMPGSMEVLFEDGNLRKMAFGR